MMSSLFIWFDIGKCLNLGFLLFKTPLDYWIGGGIPDELYLGLSTIQRFGLESVEMYLEFDPWPMSNDYHHCYCSYWTIKERNIVCSHYYGTTTDYKPIFDFDLLDMDSFFFRLKSLFVICCKQFFDCDWSIKVCK